MSDQSDIELGIQFAAIASRLARMRTGGPVTPCSGSQIEEVGRIRGPHLPASYLTFLRTMGQRAGVLWLAEDFFYPSLLISSDTDLVELAWERGVSLPAGNRTIIMDHGGYEFQWLQWTHQDEADPPVWRLLDGNEEPVRLLADRFTTYVVDQVAAWEVYLQEQPDFEFPRDSWLPR